MCNNVAQGPGPCSTQAFVGIRVTGRVKDFSLTVKEKIKILEAKLNFGPLEGPEVHLKLEIGISQARNNFL